jgi:hypothetical protein
MRDLGWIVDGKLQWDKIDENINPLCPNCGRFILYCGCVGVREQCDLKTDGIVAEFGVFETKEDE